MEGRYERALDRAAVALPGDDALRAAGDLRGGARAEQVPESRGAAAVAEDAIAEASAGQPGVVDDPFHVLAAIAAKVIRRELREQPDITLSLVREALELFSAHRRITRVLRTLDEVGLSFMSLGQSATTLSGGEAQRVKLAAELAQPSQGNTLYLLDEPTTGLHFADVHKLLVSLHRLVDAGNIVHANDTNPLLGITELQPITVIFSVAEDYLPQIQKQLRAGKKLAVDAFDRAQSREGPERRVAGGFERALDVGEWLGPAGEPRTNGLQGPIRLACGLHDRREFRRVQMAGDESKRLERLQQRRQHGHDVVDHGLAHCPSPLAL